MKSKQQCQAMIEAIKQLADKFDNLANHTRMLKTQIGQVTNSSSRALDSFIGQLETNLIEHYNIVILRSDKVLEEPKVSKESEDDIGNKKSEATWTPPIRARNRAESKEKGEEPNSTIQVRSYRPPIPFP